MSSPTQTPPPPSTGSKVFAHGGQAFLSGPTYANSGWISSRACHEHQPRLHRERILQQHVRRPPRSLLGSRSTALQSTTDIGSVGERSARNNDRHRARTSPTPSPILNTTRSLWRPRPFSCSPQIPEARHARDARQCTTLAAPNPPPPSPTRNPSNGQPSRLRFKLDQNRDALDSLPKTDPHPHSFSPATTLRTQLKAIQTCEQQTGESPVGSKASPSEIQHSVARRRMVSVPQITRHTIVPTAGCGSRTRRKPAALCPRCLNRDRGSNT